MFTGKSGTLPYVKEWCASVPDIPNGDVYRYTFQPSVAKVICHNGYQVNEENKLTCVNETWEPVKLPKCEPIGM